MNGKPEDESQPQYPTLLSPTTKDTAHGQPPSSSVLISAPNTEGKQPPQTGSSSLSPSAEKWGTHIMGAPAVPTCHPNNQKAALWSVDDQHQFQYHHYPYLQYTPIEKPSSSPMASVLQKFNTWSSKAEASANNIWHNLKQGSSVRGVAWAKVNLTAKAITGGGFESLYKQTFTTFPNENLKKSFACYLSTSTGPVAGTLYLSNVHAAFCSDRPLSFTAPSGQETWSYYKIGSDGLSETHI
ncbi:unnamed protein product [Ilex paraguariensis]|uniref:GRAM domain-containing protein n=1 Tax=Ilex paraguariensis TaxID=185542 RepID=A0ABC8URK2_9AQUA